jgi:hypothetical protein
MTACDRTLPTAAIARISGSLNVSKAYSATVAEMGHRAQRVLAGEHAVEELAHGRVGVEGRPVVQVVVSPLPQQQPGSRQHRPRG